MLMELSKHNIISKVHQSDDYFIVNLLSGNADLITEEEAQQILETNRSDTQDLIDKGYLVDPVEEGKLFRRKYLDFLDARETDEIQLFYAPTYACNFSCSYCYQEGYQPEASGDRFRVAEAFFNYISDNFSNRKKYITLFGGEPLLGRSPTYTSYPGLLNGVRI